MKRTRTTIYLSQELHRRLKSVAAATGGTITQLLAEGAAIILARYQSVADRDDLARRVRDADEELRAGLYEGPSLSDAVDDIVYPTDPPRRRAGPE